MKPRRQEGGTINKTSVGGAPPAWSLEGETDSVVQGAEPPAPDSPSNRPWEESNHLALPYPVAAAVGDAVGNCSGYNDYASASEEDQEGTEGEAGQDLEGI